MENILEQLISSFPPETVARKLRSKNVDKLLLYLTEIPSVEEYNVGLVRTSGKISYRLKNDNLTTFEMFFAGKDFPETYIFNEAHSICSLRVLGLRWRISTASKRLRRLEDTLFGKMFSQ